MSDKWKLVKLRVFKSLLIGFYHVQISQNLLMKTNFKMAAALKISQFSAHNVE